MAFQAVPDTVAIDVVYDWAGSICENTLYYTKPSPSNVEVEALVDVVTAYIRDSIIPLLTEAISLIRVIGTLLDVVDGFTVTNTTGLPAAGEVVQSSFKSFPKNVSLAVSFRTAASGRSGRGRNYVAGLADQRDANDQLSSAYANQIVTAWEGLRGIGGDDGWSQVVVSRKSGGVLRPVGVTEVVTSTILTDRTLDSQRRRLTGRGT